MNPTHTQILPVLRPTCIAVLALLSQATAQAQLTDAAKAEKAEDKEQLQTVVITGSRIRGTVPVGAVVNAVTREDIETSGATTTAQLVQQLPQVFNLGVSENSRGQTGGSQNITYGSAINLRGIGPFATLVLINGHRSVGQGTVAAAVDPSILPSLALERVEIVADGASALYGSDAIAGVANLIMRRNERGAQAYARFGFGDSYHERQVGGLWGNKWSGGQATITFENTLRSALNGRDRDFFTGDLTSRGGGDFRATQCSPGNIVIAGVTYPIPAGGVTQANAASLVPGAANKCDNIRYADLMPRQERNSLAFTFNQKLSDTVSIYADGLASRREYEIRPQATASTLNVPATNPFYVRPPGAPAGTSETVAYSFANELPQNTNRGKSTTLQGTVGVDVKVFGDWTAGAMLTRGDNRDINRNTRGLNNAAVGPALADTNPATALNVFGGKNNPATLEAISNQVDFAPGDTTFDNVVLKADGSLFELPGGKLRAAVGLEWQQVKSVGGQTRGPATNPTKFEVELNRTVKSAYAELLVPLVGERNELPGVRRLALSLAARTDRYSDVGSTSNPKIGVTWEPVKDFSLRGSYGESFRAPGLTQVTPFTNGGRGGLFVQNYSDPTNGGALRVGVALSGPNPGLTPETSKTRTLGLDWQPVSGTKLSLTWFDIAYNNQVVSYLSDLTILNREASFAGTPVIQRNPSAATVAQIIATYPLSAGVLPTTWTLFADGRNYNLGRSQTNGVDFQATSRLSTQRMGDFLLGLNGTVLTKYKVAQTPAGAMVDQLNNIYNPLKFKARAMLGWAMGPWQTNVTLTHLNAYNNNLTTPVQKVSASNTIDARVAYAFESDGLLKDATVAIGAVNLFDKKPPFVNVAQSPNGGGGFDPTLTSPIGRIISISLDKRF
jgi:iron complex outermembrane receptor protein